MKKILAILTLLFAVSALANPFLPNPPLPNGATITSSPPAMRFIIDRYNNLIGTESNLGVTSYFFPYYDGSALVTDVAPSDLGYAAATNTFTSRNGSFSGVLDGMSNVVVTTTNTNSVESPEKLMVYNLNHFATAGGAVAYTLPVAVAGKQRCYTQYTGNTGILTISGSVAGQLIDVAGVVGAASPNNVTSAGALGESACFVGIDATHWKLLANAGVWTVH